jgi:hypothetical protein
MPAVPAVLVKRQPEFPKPGERTTGSRLGLAHWIASSENPLTARVIVNRIWHQHFGAGLVRTPNDFGTMGEAATHPNCSTGWRIGSCTRVDGRSRRCIV